jgi:beta,beta-carotene 9',10'-dioxygenase
MTSIAKTASYKIDGKKKSKMGKEKILDSVLHENPEEFAIIPGVIQNMDIVDNPIKCFVQGTVPHWLRGDIVRAGPGQFTHGPDKYTHWFDGEAILMKFSIRENGSVYYQSRFVDSDVRRTNVKHGRIVHGGLGNPSIQDPCKSVFNKFFTQFWYRPKNDNTNVNVLQLGDKAYATTDVSISWKFDLDSLESETRSDLMKPSKPIPTTSAHPHYDSNGDYYNVGNLVGKNGFYAILKVPHEKFNLPDPMKEIKVFAKVPCTDAFKPSYFHSFSISENYIILHENTLKMDVLAIIHPFAWKNAMKNAFKVQDGFEFKFHVVDKKSGDIVPIKYACKPQVCFHTINAFEEEINGKRYIVVDLCTSDKPFDLFELIKFSNLVAPPNVQEEVNTYPQRYYLPLDVNDGVLGEDFCANVDTSATATLRDDGFIYLTSATLATPELRKRIPGAFDLPRINQAYNAKKYRYLYCSGSKAFVPNSLVKVDNETLEWKVWEKEGMYASEPVFVPNPEGTEEDDGVILSNVMSSDPKQLPFLLVLDAQTFEEVARAEVDARLSFCFHAHFFDKNTPLQHMVTKRTEL